MSNLFRRRTALWIAVGWGLALARISPGGTLMGSYAVIPIGSAVNLTAEGPLDWVHWAMNTEFGYDRKASVPPLIGTLVPIYCQSCGSGPYQYFDNYNGYSWSDGAPNTFATNTTTGLAIYYKFSGFQLTVP